jgi:quinohemoprotein ethanol dehydrogenase
MRRHPIGGALLAWSLLAAMAGSPADAQPARGAATVDATRIAAADSRDPGNWLSVGRTYSEQRYSPLEQIHAGNVGRLGLAWSLDLPTNRGLEGTPLVVDGIMYATASWGIVLAVDAKTGRKLWEFDPQIPKDLAHKACCDAVNRGAALWRGKVYVGVLDGRLIALDARSGKPVWTTQTVDRTKPYTITGAPRVVKGKVIIGNAGAEFGVRGYVSAYDAESGKLLWRFYTVPGDPAEPAESPEMALARRTWDGDVYWKYGGGGTVWDAMAYDPRLDLLYIGTGNGSPWNRLVRSPGGGDNLFLSSIVALNPDSGRLVWYYQTTPGDTWDFTATQHLILADLQLGGRLRQVIMQAPKNGFFYVLDRATGELLSAEKFGKVTWAERVDLRTGRPVEVPGARYEEKEVVIWPSPFGAHSWHPMSYSPKTGLVYIPYQEIPFRHANVPGGPRAFRFRPGDWNLGTDMQETADSYPAAIASGALLAWDPVNQQEAWRIAHKHPWNGGTLATAGNLVFQGTPQGQLIAYAADRGTKLWDFDARTGVIAGPMSYQIGGEQYVAVLAGWGGVFPLIGGEAAAIIGTRNVSRLLVFKLDGTKALPPVSAPPAMPKPAPVSAPPEMLAEGKKLYHVHCGHCHGLGVIAGGVVSDLRYSNEPTRMLFHDIVLKGTMAAKGMPNMSDRLRADEVDAIKAYVGTRAQEDYAKQQAGPPAR